MSGARGGEIGRRPIRSRGGDPRASRGSVRNRKGAPQGGNHQSLLKEGTKGGGSSQTMKKHQESGYSKGDRGRQRSARRLEAGARGKRQPPPSPRGGGKHALSRPTIGSQAPVGVEGEEKGRQSPNSKACHVCAERRKERKATLLKACVLPVGIIQGRGGLIQEPKQSRPFSHN